MNCANIPDGVTPIYVQGNGSVTIFDSGAKQYVVCNEGVQVSYGTGTHGQDNGNSRQVFMTPTNTTMSNTVLVHPTIMNHTMNNTVTVTTTPPSYSSGSLTNSGLLMYALLLIGYFFG